MESNQRKETRLKPSTSGSVPSSSAAKATAPRRRFPWIYTVIALFLLGAILFAQWYADTDRGVGTLVTLAATSLLVIVTAVWLAFRRSLPLAARLAPLVLLIVGIAAFFSLYRFKGWTGSMKPVFVSRWEEQRELPELKGVAQTAADESVAELTTPYDFPQFLGPERDQIITSVRLARDWESRPPKLVWKQPIGQGWSGFAVVGQRAVTQEQRGDDELVVCYHLKTGDVLWSRTNKVRFQQQPGGVGPRATPTIHRGNVYALGATGILDCLRLTTGELLWSKDIVAENGAELPEWGKACSPLIVDDLVVVSAGGRNNNSLVAYRQDSGERVWSGGSDFSAYSSPSLGNLAGVRQILIVNEDTITGHDAANGDVLWQFPWPGKSNANASISQARVVGPEHVFVSKGYSVGSALLKLAAADLEAAAEAGEPAEPEVEWKKNVMKTKLSNVCLRDGFVYGLDEEVLQCIELDSGRPRWKRGRYGHGQILMVHDLLLVQTEDGEVVLVEANPDKHVELGRFQAIDGEPCWNCPALAGRYLLVRNDQEAACYELPLEEEAVGRISNPSVSSQWH